MATVPDSQFMTNPFFDLDDGNPTIGELLGDAISASQFLRKKVNDTSLATYYDHNNGALDKISVRDWLLAEAFPATSFAMGRNLNQRLDTDNNNFDMSISMKTDDSRWPERELIEPGNREWRHSDYRDMPYQHVYYLFQDITAIASEQNKE